MLCSFIWSVRAIKSTGTQYFYFLVMKSEKLENRKYTARSAGGAATIANNAVPPLNFSVVAD